MTGWAQRQAEQAEDDAIAAEEHEAEERKFSQDRRLWSARASYLARAAGWVMIQFGTEQPRVVSEKCWLDAPIWEVPAAIGEAPMSEDPKWRIPAQMNAFHAGAKDVEVFDLDTNERVDNVFSIDTEAGWAVVYDDAELREIKGRFELRLRPDTPEHRVAELKSLWAVDS